MTLHWWMHWFWVTAQLAVILASPVPSTTEEPQTQGNLYREMMEMEENSTRISVSTDFDANSKSNFRIAKAIGIYPTGKISFQSHSSVRFQSNNNNNSNSAVIFNSTTESLVDLRENVTQERKVGDFQSNEKVLPLKFGNLKKDSKIMWILTSNKTNRSNKHYDDKDLSSPNSSDITNNNSNNNNNSDNSSNKFDIGEEGRVLPLQESKSFQSNTSSNAAQISFGNNNHSVENNSNNNQSVDEAEDIRIDESLAESQVLATAASVLDAEIGESTRLSRTRSAFTSGFQLRDQVQDSSEYNGSINESSNEPKEAASSSASNAVDIAAITGSCVATVVLLSTMGSLGFIMYRRRYLNPPQTLNSDKCSNPDSSGYIDDSTIRDNSEEMYSLDNDSFLNSLEAMTIQNYWTDSVKHTKL